MMTVTVYKCIGFFNGPVSL